MHPEPDFLPGYAAGHLLVRLGSEEPSIQLRQLVTLKIAKYAPVLKFGFGKIGQSN